MTKAGADDLEAVRTIAAALEGFASSDQERILRWVREKVGLSVATAPPTDSIRQIREGAAQQDSDARPVDLKSFVKTKDPQTDIQFAATVAYYYRFQAPEPQRKTAVTANDLQEACRLADRDRLVKPAQTLINAHAQGLLDKAGERGSYAINTVGENLVAMALPSSAGTSAKPARRKTPRAGKPAPTKGRGSKPRVGRRGRK
jgi:hypothetical protein